MKLYPLVRKCLFCLEPELAHGLTLQAVRLAGMTAAGRGLLRACFAAPERPVQAFGLRFANPVGLAAGYDKDGLGWRGLAGLGFGHIEVGTVTLRPQDGNLKPRLFRLPEDRAVINRMGFPGKGADFVARRLQGQRPAGLVLGVNIGKNKDTPLEEAAQDYLGLMRIFAPLADYLAVNVSSPNTVGLRRLQGRDALEALLGALAQERQVQVQTLGRAVPVLVKLAPDLEEAELEDALAAVQCSGMDGVIATNTTIQRSGLISPHAKEGGGLSGAPLYARSLKMVRRIGELTQGRLPVVGVGGVMGAEEARTMLEAGAALVQVYTGLIYEGPGLVRGMVGEMAGSIQGCEPG